MRRDPLGALLVLLVLGVLGFLAWATRHPDSELLARAEEWPVVGRLVGPFRAHYRVAPEPKPEESELGSVTPVREQPTPVGESMPAAEPRSVWVKSGTRLFTARETGSRVAGTVPEVMSLPVVDREGDWYQVLFRGKTSWVPLPGYAEGGAPPLGRDPEPTLPVPGRTADPEILELALDFLQGEPESGTLGEYRLVTDLEDLQLQSWLDSVARAVETAYRKRYGVSPVDRARETIVLYTREEDYRRFQDSHERLVGLQATGLVSHGVIAIFAGERSRSEITSTLVHEITHLLNRRALGPALPPWLDEGTAGDLAYSATTDSGELDPEQLTGSWRDLGSTRIIWGGRAAALEMLRATADNRTVPLKELLHLDWREFVDSEQALNYPESAFFVRFLLEADTELQSGFQRYLGDVARGAPVTSEALLEMLQRSWPGLESEFKRWLSPALKAMTAEDSAARLPSQSGALGDSIPGERRRPAPGDIAAAGGEEPEAGDQHAIDRFRSRG